MEWAFLNATKECIIYQKAKNLECATLAAYVEQEKANSLAKIATGLNGKCPKICKPAEDQRKWCPWGLTESTWSMLWNSGRRCPTATPVWVIPQAAFRRPPALFRFGFWRHCPRADAPAQRSQHAQTQQTQQGSPQLLQVSRPCWKRAARRSLSSRGSQR